MDAIFKKLNLKNQPVVFVLQHPEVFEESLSSIASNHNIKTKVRKTDKIEFFIAFVTKKADIDKIVHQVAPLLNGDAVFWMAYPKGTSKKYKADFNRDNGWALMAAYDLIGVRMVAIDEDWSAMRFRKKQFIKKLTRKQKTSPD